MSQFQIKRMIGKLIDDYKIIGHLGTGGNADVFKVQRRDEYFAMKMLIVSGNNRFNKKYSRFKDEIHVVRENQEKLIGIIPIIDIHLPETPTSNDRPWYTMPIVKPLSKSLIENVENVISCICDLSAVLVQLHEKNIVHRDIKPSNIYYYKNYWAFGDFGLVEYPEKAELTERGESVGPRNTIAPEMKRNAIHSDGKPADIYSLAKTLWILLTGVKDGFDGQYSHKIDAFNLDSRINSDSYRRHFTITLHKLLEKCTSNVPTERLTAVELKKVLEEWFVLNQNYRKRNILEWEFYLRDIIPFTLPEKISWTRLEDIYNVLRIISSTNLNHMFFPGGGGMDLNGIAFSNEEGYLELRVGQLLKLKPKRLILNTFDASFDWNYFYLETEKLEPPIYKNHVGRELYDLQLIEISPGEYIEDEEQRITNGRRVCLHINGGFVLFAKGSYYNSISSTYDGRHNRGTSDDFRNYIQRSIDIMKFDKENPEIAEERREEERKRLKEKQEKEREVYMLNFRKFEALWEEKINNLSIPNLLRSIQKGSKLLYSIRIGSNIKENYYYLSNEFRLVHYATGWYEEMNKADEIAAECLVIDDFTLVREYIGIIENHFATLKKNAFDIPLSINFEVICSRIKKPTHIFSSQDLLELLTSAKKNDRVCIDSDGKLQLVSNQSDLRIQQKQFPVVSTMSDLEYIENASEEFKYLYFTLLSAWRDHLKYNKGEVITDLDIIDLDYFDVEKKYKEIAIEMNRYPL
ncbi:Serine/threonine-protein kinase PrkC [compost metagenome]